MPCPYLEGKILKRCAVFKGMMVLSLAELNNYCTTEDSFIECEFFIKTRLPSVQKDEEGIKSG